MAPEALVYREYSVLTDIWSFGVVIYEIFTTSDPYVGNYEGFSFDC